jgi:AbrB family looped-hinge helix DNA binding protein
MGGLDRFYPVEAVFSDRLIIARLGTRRGIPLAVLGDEDAAGKNGGGPPLGTSLENVSPEFVAATSALQVALFRHMWYVLRKGDRKDIRMNTVTVSPKFQVVIPKAIRQEAGIRPGQKLEVFRVDDIIEFVPVKDIKSMRGSLPGLSTEVDRSEHDRV